MKDKETVFALDIGTRSVVGLIAEIDGKDGLRIIDYAHEEHRNRAMLDGQIHDVLQVAEVVARIKSILEQKTNTTLKEVAVAAAGRALRTQKAVGRMEISPLQEVSSDDVLTIELEGVQNAQLALAESGDAEGYEYHCVGYSVMGYKLDGQPMISLVGQRGSVIETELIATFLPRVVVDSLFAVLQRCDLEMKNLTLEPIAAINVIIPPSMRQLNLALVDVGAGTSDIAISANGTIIAYDMVPVAGDEVTEALSHKYLLDFNKAEEVKRCLMDREMVEFSDILGMPYCLPTREVLQSIDATVGSLARQIADKILTLNEKAPQAVLLVGGGSLTPLLNEKVAENLGLPKERVAVRGREAIQNLSGQLEGLKGPEFVTPVGIAATALHHQTLGFFNVQVNNHMVRLFNLHKGTVADALLAVGNNIKKLHGRPGMALTVEVNGQMKVIKGTMGTSAQIFVNGDPARLDTPVLPNDVIRYEEAVDGEDARGVIGDVIPPLDALTFVFQGREITLHPKIEMNGKFVDFATELVDGAKIKYQGWSTVGEVLDILVADGFQPKEQVLRFTLNGQMKSVVLNQPGIYLNDQPVGRDHPIGPGDRLRIDSPQVSELRVKDVLEGAAMETPTATYYLNGNAVQVPGDGPSITVNGLPATGEEFVAQGDRIEYTPARLPDLILSELMVRTHFNPTPPAGTIRLVMRVNGTDAEYVTPVMPGDRIELRWE